MGIGGISVWQLGIVLLIVILIFGTKKVRLLGEDLGGFLRGIRGASKDLHEVDDELKKLDREIRNG